MPPKKKSKPKKWSIEQFSWFKAPNGFEKKLRLGTEVLINGFCDINGNDKGLLPVYVVGYTFYELEPNAFVGWVTVIDHNGILIPSVWASRVKKIIGQLTTEEMFVCPGICKVASLWVKALKTDSLPSSYILHFTLATKKEFQGLHKKANKPIKTSAILKNDTAKAFAVQCLDKIVVKLVKIPKTNKKDWAYWLRLKEALKISLNLADAF